MTDEGFGEFVFGISKQNSVKKNLVLCQGARLVETYCVGQSDVEELEGLEDRDRRGVESGGYDVHGDEENKPGGRLHALDDQVGHVLQESDHVELVHEKVVKKEPEEADHQDRDEHNGDPDHLVKDEIRFLVRVKSSRNDFSFEVVPSRIDDYSEHLVTLLEYTRRSSVHYVQRVHLPV